MDNLSKFTARQKFIINAILEENSLSVKEISKQFDVSDRTILREVNAINNMLKPKKISIYDNNSNLSIMGKKKDIDYLEKSLDGIPLQWLLSQDQRLLIITAQLLLTDEPYKLAFFSYQLNVTEGTISLYMDKIKYWLRVRYLTLKRKRGYGISVEGSEWIKRNSIVELIYDLKPIDELCAYVYGNKKNKVIDMFFKILFGKRLFSISKNLVDIFENNVFKMDDTIYLSSLIHVLISLKKTELGNSIELPDYLIQDVVSSEKFGFLTEIKEYLESENIIITDSELTYIVIHLLGSKYIYKENGKFQEFGVSFEDISKELLYEVGKKLHIEIKYDRQLIAGLSQHINFALYRVNMDMPVKNTILDEIKEYYSDIFEAVTYACKLIFSKYNISMTLDEIGFITMHIGLFIEKTNSLNNKFSFLIICPNGIGTAKILANKLKSAIQNIKSIKIESFKDWQEESKKYDIVISTVNVDPNTKKNHENVIVVSPFLKKDDIENINEYISKLSKNRMNFNKSKLISDDVKSENLEKENDLNLDKYNNSIDSIIDNIIVETIDTKSVDDLIKIITKNAYENGILSSREEVERLIIAREKLGNVVVPNSHIALLHTRSDCVVIPFVGVYRIKNNMKLRSVGFAYEYVDTFVVLLARKKEKSYVLEQMGKISMSLIENRRLCKILRNSNINELSREIRKILCKEDI